MKPHVRRKAPFREASHPKPKLPPEAPLPSPVPDDRALWAIYTMEQLAALARVSETYPLRLTSVQAWREWAAVVQAKYDVSRRHAHLVPTQRWVVDRLTYDDFVDFYQNLEMLQGGDDKALEAAVVFLEADPWFQGSGYGKEDFIQGIIRFDVPDHLAGRLRTVVLNFVDRRNERDFRAFCRLACKVDAPTLRDELTRRLTHDDPDVRRRARWVLEALGQGEGQEKARG